MLGVDVSNYTSDLTPEALEAWKNSGIGLVLVQSIDPPPGYPAGKTRQQIQQCLDTGLTVDAYIWLWFDLDVADIRRKLALLDGLPIRRIWLDVEDTAAQRYDQATTEAKIADALYVCDEYFTPDPRLTGIYTGRWFWTDSHYADNTEAFSVRDLWDSNYDDIPDASQGFRPYGGWTGCAIKQYHGTMGMHGVWGIDMNVLSDEEAATLSAGNGGDGDVTDPEREAMQETINGLVNSLGYIAGDLLAPVVPQKTSTKAVRNLVAGIRAQAEAHGIAHA